MSLLHTRYYSLKYCLSHSKAIALLAVLGLSSGLATRTPAQPIVPEAEGTATTVTPMPANQGGTQYEIQGGARSQDGANLFHSFQQFGLKQADIANFISNPEINNILGRVTGGNASIINGLIQVTGGNSNLFLINPAGIVFGANASLNVPGDFFATTATGIGFGNNGFQAIGENNWETLVGNPSNFAFELSQPGLIANFGDLNLEPNQNLTLLGGTVLNAGNLTSPGGNITIAAIPGSNLVRISQPGHLLSLEIEPLNPSTTPSAAPSAATPSAAPSAANPTSAATTSAATTSAANPTSAATPTSAANLPQLLTGNQEITNASTVTVSPDGSIKLTGSGISLNENNTSAGTAIVSGAIDVSVPEFPTTGGNINILGQQVRLLDANLNASGITGGGNIRIGGDFQGQGNIFNAQHTFSDRNSTIKADALNQGNGGRVILWADHTTNFQGNITARGGLQLGNGGFVEVSGKQHLIFRGNVDTTAPNGNFGTLLLDPINITIVDGNGGEEDNQLNADVPNPGDAAGQIFANDDPLSDFTISEIALEGLAATTDVILQAENDITINDLTDNELTFAAGPGGSITFTAGSDQGGGGSFSMNTGDTIRAESRDVTINGADITVGTIDTSTTNPANNGGNITFDGLISNTNPLVINSGGDVTFKGEVGQLLNSGINSGPSGLDITANGTVTFNSQSWINGNISITAADIDSADVLNLRGPENADTYNVTFEPIDPNADIIIGGTDSTNGQFHIDQAELVQNINSSGTVTIGSARVTGNVEIENIGSFNDIDNFIIDANFDNPNYDLIVQGGQINFNNTIDIIVEPSIPKPGTLILKPGKIASFISSGNITHPGSSPVVADGSFLFDAANSIGTNANPIKIDNITFAAQTTSGGIFIDIGSNNSTVDPVGGLSGINSAGDIYITGTGTLKINQANISTSGNIEFDNPVIANSLTLDGNVITINGNFNADDLTITNKSLLNISGAVTTNNGAFTQNGTGAVELANNITTSGSNIDFNSDVTIKAGATLDTTNGGSVTTGANISLPGSVTDTGNQALTLDAGIEGTIDLGSINLEQIIFNEGNTLNLNGDLTTNTIIDFHNLTTVNVINDLAISSNDTINFGDSGRLQGGQQNLFLDSTNINIGRPVNLNDLTIDNSGILTIFGLEGINLNGAFQQTGIGKVKLDTQITTINENIEFNGAVELNKDISLNTGTGAGDVIFNNSIDALNAGTESLTVDAGTGDVIFNQVIGSESAPGNLTINSSGITQFNDTLNVSTLTTDTAGTSEINGNISTSGIQQFNDPVIVTGDRALSSSDNSITFNNTVDGNTVGSDLLTVDAGTGTINFNNTVGSNTRFNRLDLNSPVNLNNNITADFLNFGNTLYLTGDIAITGDEIDFANSVSGNGNLSIQPVTPNRDITLGESNDTETNILDLTATDLNNFSDGFSSITIARSDNSGSVTVDNSTFSDPVTIQSPNGSITVNGDITGTGDATITLNSNANTLNAGITTENQNITIQGNTTLGNDVTLDTGTNQGDIAINGTVDGNQALTVDAGTGNITFAENVGESSELNALIANSSGETRLTAINAESLTTDAGGTTFLNGDISTTNSVEIDNAVVLSSDVILNTTTGDITFGSTIDGNQTLDLNAANGNVSVSGAVGSNTPINRLQVTGDRITLANPVSATNNAEITATGEINTSDITANAGIALNSDTNVTTGNLTTSNATGGGSVSVTAPNSVQTGNINTSSSTGSSTGNGSPITLTSLGTDGRVVSGDLNASGAINGGDITVQATQEITAEMINSSGTSGAGGNVLLNRLNDLKVTSINAEGGTSGGNVDITVGQFFRGTDTFSDRNGNSASISTIGGTDNGSITIRHGGNGIIPFIVGDATTNGTAGNLTTGVDTISDDSFLYTYTLGDIAIISVPEPPKIDPRIPVAPTPATSDNPLPSQVDPSNPVFIPSSTATTTPITTPATTTPITTPATTTPITTPATTTPITIPITTPEISQPLPQVAIGENPVILEVANTVDIVFTQLEEDRQLESSIFYWEDFLRERPWPELPQKLPQDQLLWVEGNIFSDLYFAKGAVWKTMFNITKLCDYIFIGDSCIRTDYEIAGYSDDGSILNTADYSDAVNTGEKSSNQTQINSPEYVNDLTAANNDDNSDNSDSSVADSEVSNESETTGTNNSTNDLWPSNNSSADVAEVRPASLPEHEEKEIDQLLWNIEQSRNEEFNKYLGVRPNLPRNQITFAGFQEILKSLELQTGKRSAIIYTIAREEYLELILVPSIGRPIHRFVPEATPEILFSVVNEFRQEITNPLKLRTKSYLSSSQQLYEWIMAPLKEKIDQLGIETLMFSMDPGLRSLPIAALHDGEKFLIEQYSFSLIPSFSLTPHEYQSITNARVLAMGASDFPNQPSLPGVPLELAIVTGNSTEQEGDRIESLKENDSCPTDAHCSIYGQTFLNDAFTLDNLQTSHQTGNFEIIHLATHAYFTSGSPNQSYISFANDPLTLEDMADLDWHNPAVELLVLSGCQTALGDLEAELGFAGLAVQSGVKSAIASLWYISDQGTLGLMAEFYHQLRQAPIKAEALRQAQLAMIRDEVRLEGNHLIHQGGIVPLPDRISTNMKLSHPYFWSGFTTIGSPW